MDIAYLIVARSDAYSLLQDPSAAPGWKYGCDYEVIEKFADPMSIVEIKADPALRGWNALNARFQRSAFRMQPEVWDHLIVRLVADPTQTKRQLARARRLFSLESVIESTLAARPLGPRVTLTASARALTPASSSCRASTLKRKSLAMTSFFRWLSRQRQWACGRH